MKVKTIGDFGRLLRFLRLSPKGKDRSYKKKGPAAKTRQARLNWIGESQRQGIKVAADRRAAYVARRSGRWEKLFIAAAPEIDRLVNEGGAVDTSVLLPDAVELTS